PSTVPADLPQALVLGLAQFPPLGKGPPKPLPATMTFLVRRGGEWRVSEIEDVDSDVFHKVLAYRTPDGEQHLLSGGGTKAMLKLWRKTPQGHVAETLWEKDFGGRFSRMRDIEVGDLYGDGRQVIAIATHDQGVVALVVPEGDGYAVEELDQEADTFVHEIELGDLDGDGVLEVYATPSEPNRLDGSTQSGRVTRYVPAKGEGRVVVADLGDRHAKEIFVDDLDGDGRDELYVIVEGNYDKKTKALTRKLEIRRYEAGTDPAGGAVIGEFDDYLGRFLTAGDLDGDGQPELVAALKSVGVWLLRPGSDPTAPWKTELIDRESGGFEHASIIADLDADGRDELYVVSDKDAEIRRYTWEAGERRREVIHERTHGNTVFTWNIMPVPASLAP
nr:VCBS repeat-containing protein [Myxococcota bacterium]